MLNQTAPQAQPKSKPAASDPVVVLDVAPQTQAKETPSSEPANSATDERQRLEDVLPAINEIARKVGGFRKLAEIAQNLDQHRV